MTLGEVMRRAFPTTLKGAARVWFSKIPLATIAKFEQLSKSLVHHFIRGQRHKKPTGHLLNIHQAKGESQRQYVICFNKKLLQMDEVEDQAGLLPGDFFFSITKSPPWTIAELLHNAHKYMNVKDKVTAKEMTSKRKRDKGSSHHLGRKKETRSTRHTTDKKKSLMDQRLKFTNLTPLVMPIEQELMQIKDQPSLHWPQPIYAPTKVRDKSKYCSFNQDHGHRMDKCRHLKDQIQTLIRQGKLQKFVRKMDLYRQ